MSFDMAGSRGLFVGDAGQNLWEEVSIAVKGGNFGWNVKEGAHCFSTDNPDETPAECPDAVAAPHPRAGDPLIDPVIEYQNEHNPLGGGLGHATVGGHVYRGTELRQFSGDYIFGDYSREEEEPDGSLFVAKPRKQRLWQLQQLRIATSPTGRLGHFVLGFGQDPAGESTSSRPTKPARPAPPERCTGSRDQAGDPPAVAVRTERARESEEGAGGAGGRGPCVCRGGIVPGTAGAPVVASARAGGTGCVRVRRRLLPRPLSCGFPCARRSWQRTLSA